MVNWGDREICILDADTVFQIQFIACLVAHWIKFILCLAVSVNKIHYAPVAHRMQFLLRLVVGGYNSCHALQCPGYSSFSALWCPGCNSCCVLWWADTIHVMPCSATDIVNLVPCDAPDTIRVAPCGGRIQFISRLVASRIQNYLIKLRPLYPVSLDIQQIVSWPSRAIYKNVYPELSAMALISLKMFLERKKS